MKNIILGITGSIAAYKGAELANLLTKEGFSVQVIMTAASRKFITSLTFQTLTKNKVYTDMFDEFFYEDVRHISLAQKADIAVIAPASANFIGKLASGIADDMLSTVIMALGGRPVLICPAMNTAMYENPIVRGNVKKLSDLGYRFAEPREARLACGDLGKGALADVRAIADTVRELTRQGGGPPA
jgi:phosphopantothenoylcysteine decarboxylase/phosphopantothenoylcysteine decarboxylase/phosphopantothenate--cysteine ligase